MPAAVWSVIAPAAARRRTANAGAPATPNDPACIFAPGESHSSAACAFEPVASSVKELTAWTRPFVRRSFAVGSSVRSVAVGKAPVCPISQSP